MKKILLLLILSTLFMQIKSQVVNIEKKRKRNHNGLQGNFSLSLNFKDNGKKIYNGKNNIDIQYTKNASTFIFLNELKLMRVDTNNLINSGFQHLRYNYTIKDSSFLTLEAFVQNQYNSAKLLKRRVILGFGPRFRIVDKKNFLLYFAPLTMYEYEQLSDDNETVNELIKLDAYLSLWFKISKFISVGTISYYQPDYTDFNNYRISSETSLIFKLTSKLSFKFVYNMNYDSRPPEDIQKLFYGFTNKITYSF